MSLALFVLVLLIIQALGSVAYSILWPGESWVAMVYVLSKVLMVFLPIIAWKYFGISWKKFLPRLPFRERVLAGVWGIGTCLITGGALWILLESIVPFSLTQAREQATAFGLNRLSVYLLFALGISLVHSLFEEWYWRATAVPLLQRFFSFPWSAFLGGLAFATHHILVLSLFTSWPWAIVLGLVVGVAGWAWSCFAYWRGHFWYSWASHIGADLAIFAVGGRLLGFF